MLLLIILLVLLFGGRRRLLRVFQMGERRGAGDRRDGPAHSVGRVPGRRVALTSLSNLN